ncbi:MAG: Bifunctional aspartokinase/homoserine dehydrogenase 1 [Sodalis sp.]|nr:MAG: Bifunctional aspartokinase/homoserine dehydrogenase 1 [Sodalis sp.]
MGYLGSTIDIAESTRRLNDIPRRSILMAGFTAGNERGELVVPGRRSDYSAAVPAAFLRAGCCEIWMNVNGVYTCDPNQVPDARVYSVGYSIKKRWNFSTLAPKFFIPELSSLSRSSKFLVLSKTTNPQAPGTLIWPTSAEEGNPVKVHPSE